MASTYITIYSATERLAKISWHAGVCVRESPV